MLNGILIHDDILFGDCNTTTTTTTNQEKNSVLPMSHGCIVGDAEQSQGQSCLIHPQMTLKVCVQSQSHIFLHAQTRTVITMWPLTHALKKPSLSCYRGTWLLAGYIKQQVNAVWKKWKNDYFSDCDKRQFVIVSRLSHSISTAAACVKCFRSWVAVTISIQ